jgi:ATP-dependent DNA helicase RecQ
VKIYDSLCNYYQIGVGSGLERVFAFDIADFCVHYKLPILITYNALKLLQQAGYIELTDEQENSSRVLFTVDRENLYKLHQSPEQDKLIHILLRSYTGLFTDPAYINEDLLAKRMEWTRERVYDELVLLSKERIIEYIPRKKTPYITFTLERQETERIVLGKEAYDDRRDRYITRVKSVLDYAKEENVCRSQVLLSYFGEKNTKSCGQCDVCLKNKENEVSTDLFEKIKTAVFDILRTEPLPINSLLRKIPFKEPQAIQVIRFLIDNGHIEENELMQLNEKK